jgi:tetratricopeptide (TPR) repeat protein
MDNGLKIPNEARMRNLSVWTIGILFCLSLSGCVENQPPKKVLNEGYTALEQQQYDEAIGKADEFLSQSPAGPGSAEALYLRGRGFEQKVARSPMDAQVNLQNARTSYIQALEQKPSAKLEAYIRTSLANVAYFQDDYKTALEQWSAAYGDKQDADVQAWTLYRMGICRQRLGQFAQADQVFAAVQERYPNTVPAQRAREHSGARSFQVQLATFASPSGADQAMAQLKREGVAATRIIDSKGRSVIRVGPVATYPQAQALKARFASRYPDAMILP